LRFRFRRLFVQTTEKSVKMRKDGKTVEVDVIPVPVYENLAEALEAFGGDEAKVLSLINTQNATNMMNTARAKHKPTTLKGQKMFDALYNCLTDEEALEVVGSAEALREKLYSDEIQERLKAKIEAAS